MLVGVALALPGVLLLGESLKSLVLEIAPLLGLNLGWSGASMIIIHLAGGITLQGWEIPVYLTPVSVVLLGVAAALGWWGWSLIQGSASS
jgi:hypothetical protein